MVIKNVRIEDVLMFAIVMFAFLYPVAIALIIYKSDRTAPKDFLKPIIEYFQDKNCPKESLWGLNTENAKNLTGLCEKIHRENYTLRDISIEDEKAILSYGKKVKGLEKSLIIEIFFEKNKIKAIKYEEGY